MGNAGPTDLFSLRDAGCDGLIVEGRIKIDFLSLNYWPLGVIEAFCDQQMADFLSATSPQVNMLTSMRFVAVIFIQFYTRSLSG